MVGSLIRPIACGSCLVTCLLAACDTSSSEPSNAAADAGDGGPHIDDAGSSDANDANDARRCTLPGVFGNEACHECLRTRCCGPLDACEANAACKPLLACVITCFPKPDAGGCRSDCEAKNPGGGALLDDAALCFGRKSDATCGEFCSAP